jgi:hypothetical protein
LIHSLRTIRKFWRTASPVQVGADGGRKFDVKDASWASEMTSDRRRLLLKAKSLPACPSPTIGFSDAGITPCTPTGSLFLSILRHCPCSRRAAGSRVVRASHHRWLVRARELPQPWRGEKKSGHREPEKRARQANRSRSALAAGFLVKHTCFRPFSIGNWDWKSGVQVPNRAILERETGSNAKSNPFLGRWNAGGRGSRSNPKTLDWTCDLERPVEMLVHAKNPNDVSTLHCNVSNSLIVSQRQGRWASSRFVSILVPSSTLWQRV